MVQHPAVADVSKALWSYASPSQVGFLSPHGSMHCICGNLPIPWQHQWQDHLLLESNCTSAPHALQHLW